MDKVLKNKENIITIFKNKKISWKFLILVQLIFYLMV